MLDKYALAHNNTLLLVSDNQPAFLKLLKVRPNPKDLRIGRATFYSWIPISKRYSDYIAFLQLTASSRPSAPPSDSTKCLRFGHWLTLCTLNIHLLTFTYLPLIQRYSTSSTHIPFIAFSKNSWLTAGLWLPLVIHLLIHLLTYLFTYYYY